MTNLLVKAGLVGAGFPVDQISARLPLEPGLYLDQTNLLLSNLHPSAEVTVFGPVTALSNLQVRHDTQTFALHLHDLEM